MEGAHSSGTIRSLGAIDAVFALDGLERLRCDSQRPVVARNLPMLIEGWMAHPGMRACRDVAAVVDGEPFARARFVRRHRPDVASAYAAPALDFAGFAVILPANSLSAGRHEIGLQAESDSTASLSLVFEIAPPVRERTPVRDDGRLALTCDLARRIERGVPAVARGTVPHGARELYAVVDGCDAFPAQLDAPGLAAASGTVPFLACFGTQHLSFGEHAVRFAATLQHESALHVSEPFAFSVTPVSVAGFWPRWAAQYATASIDWADAPESASVAEPARRRFARGDIACVHGWAVDTAASDGARSAFLRFANGATFAMEMRGLRDDVARSLGIPAARYCGFTGSIAADALDAGGNAGDLYIVSKHAPAAYRTHARIEMDVVD